MVVDEHGGSNHVLLIMKERAQPFTIVNVQPARDRSTMCRAPR
jgi:hypothetical protein